MAARNKPKWTTFKRGRAIEMYVANEPMAKIAKAVGIHISNVRSELNSLAKAITNERISRTKCGNQWNNASKELRLSNPALLEEEFQKLLSEPEDPMLTEAEEKFIWAYSSTGDYMTAAIKAGFDVGYFTMEQIKGGKRGEKKKTYEESYQVGVKLRIAALRMKPNVKARLDELENSKMFDAEKVNKQYLQRVIMRQMDNFNFSSAEDMKLHRDYVQMLGRTFGGFTEKIEIGVVDHKKSLRKLSEIARTDDLASLRAAKEAEKQQDKAVGDQQDGMDS